MVKDGQKAWDRFEEQIDLEDIYTTEELKEAFERWVNPRTRESEKFDKLLDYIEDQFETWIADQPTEERVFRQFTAEQRPPEPETFEKAYTYALETPEKKVAWGRYWGTLPYQLRKTAEARALWKQIARFFL
jgi:hypothetical protein